MLATFTTNLIPVVLSDDANQQGGGKIAFVLQDFSFDSGVMIQPCYGAAAPFKTPTGNTDRKLAFIGTRTLASNAAVLEFLKTLSGMVNLSGTLVLKEGASTLTGANAILKSARRDSGQSVGARIAIQYQFEITTLT